MSDDYSRCALGLSPFGHGGAMPIWSAPPAAPCYAYPKDADPDTTRPYVMWAGTPYRHLMVPVK